MIEFALTSILGTALTRVRDLAFLNPLIILADVYVNATKKVDLSVELAVDVAVIHATSAFFSNA
jgi:hypothetical protein